MLDISNDFFGSNIPKLLRSDFRLGSVAEKVWWLPVHICCCLPNSTLTVLSNPPPIPQHLTKYTRRICIHSYFLIN